MKRGIRMGFSFKRERVMVAGAISTKNTAESSRPAVREPTDKLVEAIVRVARAVRPF